jgi:hypothetical protein
MLYLIQTLIRGCKTNIDELLGSTRIYRVTLKLPII